MCLLLLGSQVLACRPLVVAANRDEYYDRPAAPPGVILDVPRAVGGKDLRSGGTWLGLNEYGLVAAVTNRHAEKAPDPRLPSRGLLCLEALRQRTAREAAAHLGARLGRARYNPFNLLLADLGEVWFVTNAADTPPRRLGPGWHIVGNGDPDDLAEPRVARAKAGLAAAAGCAPPALPALLARLCRDHGAAGGGTGADAVCVHRAEAGTRSAAIVVARDAACGSYWHADGAPCTAAYGRVEVPWWRPLEEEGP